ncbi:MAG TPA: beta-ketoacyl synthase N-terminal-like domain-containing protein [Pyrinomonadaceae bacterium]
MSDTQVEQIAIIGMAVRFPGAASVDTFWRNLRDGVESISFFSEAELIAAGVNPALVSDRNYVRASAVLDDVETFDADFFGFTPREAEVTDPQQRLFLECAWEVMESAGYVSEETAGRVGVFAGAGPNRYLLKLLSGLPNATPVDVFQFLIGNERDHLPPKVSYKLNLTGPSINVQTACSTSLVAVALACQSLLSYQCDAAIAGGVSIALPQKAGYYYEEGGVTSPDGHCRTFDARARGTVVGSGAGAVFLKRYSEALADHDQIHAVIRGAAINNDGAARIGYTAPGVDGQAAVIAEALAVAGIEPSSVGYVEAHGTATPLGDPIEVAALTKAFRHGGDQRTAACALGSVKTNLGHLDAAAGVAGLVKVVEALKHKQIPPSLHFESPNPEIDFRLSPFYVNSKLADWSHGKTPRRACVSSFGIGGTNAHLVLEEARPTVDKEGIRSSPQLLVLSARSKAALDQSVTNLAKHLRQNEDVALADLAFTLQTGRKSFAHRMAVVCDEVDSAAEGLERGRVFAGEHKGGAARVAMMFPGQGAQQLMMGAELYETIPEFRRELDFCADVLKRRTSFDLREVLYPEELQRVEAEKLIQQTAIAQPALFSVAYSLAKLWERWGVKPFAMIGHSIGEYVAACLAGVFSAEDALWLVAERGRLAQQLPEGAMLAVAVTETEALALTSDELSLAAINGPAQCVLAGEIEAVVRLEQTLTADGVTCVRLQGTRAFHSAMVQPMMPAFAECFSRTSLHAPTRTYVSSLTGTWVTNAEATSAGFWVRQLREPVRFADGIRTLCGSGVNAFLEVGPGQTLSSLVRSHPDRTPDQIVLGSLGRKRDEHGDVVSLLEALGELWIAGVEPRWKEIHESNVRRVSLPTYPFERKRYWVDVAQARAPEPDVASAVQEVNVRAETYTQTEFESRLTELWKEVFALEQISVDADFFELGGNSLTGLQLISRVRKTFDIDLPMRSFFEAPTIAGLARLIEEKINGEEEDFSELEELLKEIEGMSPEELKASLG